MTWYTYPSTFAAIASERLDRSWGQGQSVRAQQGKLLQGRWRQDLGLDKGEWTSWKVESVLPTWSGLGKPEETARPVHMRGLVDDRSRLVEPYGDTAKGAAAGAIALMV